MTDLDVSSAFPTFVQPVDGRPRYDVMGMFKDGRFEVLDRQENKYETFNINDLLADKKALDEIVEVFNTSDDASTEAVDIWHKVDAVRHDTLEQD